ncbi:MAG: endonuclease domain-containing protein [Vicingus serpentipes]|nr:endonuclease domain-containing protein [Vicingus serpentipes]
MRNRIIPYEPHLKPLTRKLRKNMTLGEVLLWQEIRKKSLGVEFHRQVPIAKYIVDFYCHELSLIIEVDGASHNFDDAYENDVVRQTKLEHLGLEFIRFDDAEIKNDMNNVLRALQIKIEELNGKI